MKCPKCGKEFSEYILPLHMERCVVKNEEEKPKKETKTSKK